MLDFGLQKKRYRGIGAVFGDVNAIMAMIIPKELDALEKDSVSSASSASSFDLRFQATAFTLPIKVIIFLVLSFFFFSLCRAVCFPGKAEVEN